MGGLSVAGLDEQKKRTATIGMIAVGCLILGWITIIDPGLKKIKSVDSAKESLKSKEDVLGRVIDGEKKLAEYQKYMAPSRDMAQLIQELADLAEKSSVQITSISPEKSGIQSPDNAVERLSVSVEVECSYHQLGSFISVIESMDRFTKITRLEFGKVETTDSKLPGAKKGLVVVSRYFAGEAQT